MLLFNNYYAFKFDFPSLIILDLSGLFYPALTALLKMIKSTAFGILIVSYKILC